MEAELARQGYALMPAEPAVVVFADGNELVWPADRGAQYAALTDGFGGAVAQRWRDLVDRLDRVWQTLRPLGWEADRRDADLNRAVRRDLLGRQSVADLARAAGHPHLEALVRSVAHRLGGVPDQTPAWAAVELSLQRTFRPLAGSASRGQRPDQRRTGPILGSGRSLGRSAQAAPSGCAPGERRHGHPGRDRASRRGRDRFGGTAGAGRGQHGRPLVHVRHAAPGRDRSPDPAPGAESPARSRSHCPARRGRPARGWGAGRRLP